HSAAALAADLDNWIEGRAIEARPVGRTERAWLWCRRRPLVAGLAALFLAMLIPLGFGLAEFRRQIQRAEEERHRQQAVAQKEIEERQPQEAAAKEEKEKRDRQKAFDDENRRRQDEVTRKDIENLRRQGELGNQAEMERQRQERLAKQAIQE